MTNAPELQALAPGLYLDCRRPALIHEGRAVPLTPAEYACLTALVQRAGTSLTRREILDAARGADSPSGERAVDVLIVALRSKLGPHAGRIETVRGVGYRLRPGDSSVDGGDPWKS